MIYCPKDPKGKLLEGYASPSAWEALTGLFNEVASREGREWEIKYWKKPEAFRAWLKKNGWTIVKCDLVERK